MNKSFGLTIKLSLLKPTFVGTIHPEIVQTPRCRASFEWPISKPSLTILSGYAVICIEKLSINKKSKAVILFWEA
jgi:hypothetical protein